MAASTVVKGRYSSYKLLDEVGRGGSALVYRAQDLATKADVAVKQLLSNSKEDAESWRREVDALTALNKHQCSNVVRYLDHMQQGGRLFVVEEFADRGSLLAYQRRRGKLTELEVCEMVYQLVCGLERIHHWGFIHGDLKASNALLFKSGVVKLTDFALLSRCAADQADQHTRKSSHRERAHHNSSSTNNNSSTSNSSKLDGPSASVTDLLGATPASNAEGTPLPSSEFRGSVYWAAPEVLSGTCSATPASDIWALACLTMELLTGRPPYFDRSIPNAVHHILRLYYDEEGESVLMPPLDGLEACREECLSFLRRCFRRNPVDRPTAAQLMQDPWFIDVTVPQLLRAVSGGASANGAAVVGEEEGGGSSDGTSGPTAKVDVNRFSNIEQWVERNLISDQEMRCAAWLRSDALALLVPALTPRLMTPAYIGRVMWCFSHFAEGSSSLAPLFLDRLGATDLWGVEELTYSCDASHLVALFRRCCDVQDTSVAVFTPTHPRALLYILQLEKAKAQEGIKALHALFVRGGRVHAAGSSEDLATDAAGAAGMTRAQQARTRLLSEGGAAVLCYIIEKQCHTAFLNTTSPALEWPSINLLLEVLWQVSELPRGQRLLWGFTPHGTEKDEPVTRTVTSTGSFGGSGLGGGGAAVHESGEAFASTAAANSTPCPPQPSEGGGSSPHSTNATNTAAASTTTTPSTTAAVAVNNSSPTVNTTTNAAASSNNTDTAASAVATIAAGGSGSAAAICSWTTSTQWLMAVQEAAHHYCTAGARLMMSYISLASKLDIKTYVEKAGTSLAATMVLIASQESMPVDIRRDALKCLPLLHTISPRAARYLRDPVRCMPLLAITLRRASPEMAEAFLETISCMGSEEKHMWAPCIGSPWIWDAMAHQLTTAYAACRGAKEKEDGAPLTPSAQLVSQLTSHLTVWLGEYAVGAPGVGSATPAPVGLPSTSVLASSTAPSMAAVLSVLKTAVGEMLQGPPAGTTEEETKQAEKMMKLLTQVEVTSASTLQ